MESNWQSPQRISFLPRKLQYQENLSRVDPIIRQIFVVHSAFIVFVLVAFAALCFLFAPEFSATPLGRFLSGWLALFWALRLVVQWVYYDAEVRHQNRLVLTIINNRML